MGTGEIVNAIKEVATAIADSEIAGVLIKAVVIEEKSALKIGIQIKKEITK